MFGVLTGVRSQTQPVIGPNVGNNVNRGRDGENKRWQGYAEYCIEIISRGEIKSVFHFTEKGLILARESASLSFAFPMYFLEGIACRSRALSLPVCFWPFVHLCPASYSKDVRK